MKQRVLIFVLTMCLPSWGATYYVLAGGTGTHNGTNWANANCKIPNPLAAGDVVYIGNSGGNLADTTTTCAGEATHTFTGSGTSSNHITIKAATGADHGTGTGWNSSYGVDVTPKITWSNSFVPSNGLKNPFWDFCGNYYDVNGEVGTTDTTGTYGFYFRSAGRMFAFIRADSHACSEASLTNFTFNYVELDGVEANNTLNGAEAGAGGIYLGSPVSTTATVQNITLRTSYLHDIFGPITSAGSVTGLTLNTDWIYTNFSDAAQHSNAIDTQAPGTIGINNLTVSDTVFKNIQGTAVIACLNGTCDGWKIYNNIFYYTSDWDSICEHGDSTATCGISKWLGDNSAGSALTNSVFYGNTLANIHIKPGHAGADDAGIVIQVTGSGANRAENNLWWNCTIGGAFDDGSNGKPNYVTHDYNTLINTGYATAGMVLSAHEYQIGSTPGGVGVDPFMDAYGDFRLVSETVDGHLNDGVALPSPYNLDFVGTLRGSDGTWERGAYELSNADLPNPPTGLHVLSIQ